MDRRNGSLVFKTLDHWPFTKQRMFSVRRFKYGPAEEKGLCSQLVSGRYRCYRGSDAQPKRSVRGNSTHGAAKQV